MSILLGIWIMSLASIVGVLLYGRMIQHQRGDEASNRAAESPTSFSEVVSHELATLNRDIRALIDALKPHGVRTIASGVTIVRKGQEVFISRVYGRIKTQKGRASSFFLKQIAEHQGSTRSRDGLGRL